MPARAFQESKARLLLVISLLKGAWSGLSLSKNHGSLSRVPASCLFAQTGGNCFVHEESPASFLAFPAEELRLHRLAVTIAAGPEEQRDLKLLLSCLCSAPVSTVLVRLVHTWLIVISKANVTRWPETAPSIWQLRFARWNCHGHSSVCLSRDAGGKSGLLARREVLSPQSSPLPVDSQWVTGPSRVKRFALWTVEGLLVACWYLANVWVRHTGGGVQPFI